MRRTILAFALGFLLICALAWLFVVLTSCASKRPVVTANLVTAAHAYAELEQANHDVFEREVAQLRRDAASLGDGGRAAYDTAYAPMEAEFDARVEALVTLNSELRAAGLLLDAAKAGDAEGVLDAARAALHTIEVMVGKLQTNKPLPPVPIPDSVKRVILDLGALVNTTGPPADQQDGEVQHGG